VPHAEQEMPTLPEHLISPVVFIEVRVVLSFVSPYFMYNCLVFWILNFDFFFFLLCGISIFFTFKHLPNLNDFFVVVLLCFNGRK